MKKIAVLFSAIFAVMVLSFSATFAQTIEIPNIEQWEETTYPFGDHDMGHKTKTVVIWHKDPQGNGYEGDVLYYKNSSGKLVMLSKSWNFINYGGGMHDFDWSKTRVALLLENGEWFVGDEGEMLRIKREYNEQNEVIAVTYQFAGSNASVSRTINFQ